MEQVWTVLREGIEMPFSYLMSSEKRIFYAYLISSAVLAFYVFKISKQKGSFLKYLFHPKVWWSKSAFIDYSLVFFNAFVKILLIGPYLIFGLYIAFYFSDWLVTVFGYQETSLNVKQVMLLYTLSLVIVGDFASYLTHFLQHKVKFLWEFHKIHHAAEVLNPVTQYRLHPIELLLNNARSIVIFGLVTGVFDYLSTREIVKVTFLGANVFSFLFLVWGSNLRHSHVKLKYFNFLEYIFISPFQHQIHHSDNPAHFDKNMGAKLAIWDWLFGTLVRSKQVTRLQFGLGEEKKDYNSFFKNLYMPFLKIIGLKR